MRRKSSLASYPLLDTKVIIGREIPRPILLRMYLSSVVLYELIAANIDESTLQYYTSWKQTYGKEGRLLTPTMTDWFESSKLIRNMLRGAKSQSIGNVAKITSAQRQQNDALIARTAWLHGCFIVTDNTRDFDRFKPYLKGLTTIPADYFFN